MAIFNSLGSNYTNGFWLKMLFGGGKQSAKEEAEAKLGVMFSGTVTFTYKGRQALELALRSADLPKGSKVGINGFTCYVVYEAVIRAGLVPVFIDVAPNTLHYTESELRKSDTVQAVIIQNTLGLPADVQSLEKYCEKQSILLIEDLAHSLGSQYADKRVAGTVASHVMLSFSQDKQLDVVAGGAYIRRVDNTREETIELVEVPVKRRIINRLYPALSGIIRTTYSIKIGRYVHFCLKKLHLLATPMGGEVDGIGAMTNHTASVLLTRLEQQQEELAHRRRIADIYRQELPDNMLIKAIGTPSYLRFPILVSERASLLNFLKADNIYLGDTWYDAPIAPKRYMARTNYEKGSCPEAENICERIVNLPTHEHITPELAQFICAKIKRWQKS